MQTANPPIIRTTSTGQIFILPYSNAEFIENEVVSPDVLAACFPRVLRGDAHNGITYNPLTTLCELRIDGTIAFQAETVWECERHAKRGFSRIVETPAPPVAKQPRPRPAQTRAARNDWERARFALFAVAREYGVVAKNKMETETERKARLACLAAWCGVPEVESIHDLGASQLDSVSAAIRRGDIRAGWMITELAA
jgi:hypothetical protein